MKWIWKKCDDALRHGLSISEFYLLRERERGDKFCMVNFSLS